MILGNFSSKEFKIRFFYKIRKFGKLIVNDLVNHYFTFILRLVLNCFLATAKVFTNVNYYNGMELWYSGSKTYEH
jgi:hypothetical protein